MAYSTTKLCFCITVAIFDDWVLFKHTNIWRQITAVHPYAFEAQRKPTNSTLEARLEWKAESAKAKATLPLLLSTSVQIRSITICDDPERTAYDLWNFLETTYTASNE